MEAISKNLMNIYLLFTREPFVNYFTKELEYYCNKDKSKIGLILLDLTDNNYSIVILSRDKSRQYKADDIKIDINTLIEAREVLRELINNDEKIEREYESGFFDLFKDKVNNDQLNPFFKILRDNPSHQAARKVIEEISYHYTDIDGNFVDQFQSINGFDARLWELYLYCFLREQGFSFTRNHYAPDYMIEKFGNELAIEAVVLGRDKEHAPGTFKIDDLKSVEEINEIMKNEMPLKYGSALFSKLKKRYWEKPHVKGKPFLIAIADFHEEFGMTWSFNALIEFLYGDKHDYYYDEDGKLHVTANKIEGFEKKNGKIIPAGFFSQPEVENISAIIFSSTATLSKFTRMGVQAGLGSEQSKVTRQGLFYNHEENASKPNMKIYEVDESCNETWSEGVTIFHNPNAKIVLDKGIFSNTIAQCESIDGVLYSDMPDVFPYSSQNVNLIIKKTTK